MIVFGRKKFGIILLGLSLFFFISEDTYAEVSLPIADCRDYRVLVIYIDPIIHYNGGMPASEYLGFNRDDGVKALQSGIEKGSNGTINVEIVDTVWLNEFPKYREYESMTEEQFFKLYPQSEPVASRWYGWWDRNASMNVLPEELDGVDGFDYEYLMEKCNLVERRNNGEFDTVWVFSIDPSGMWEANIVGRGMMRSNGEYMERDCDNFLLLGLTYSRTDGVLEAFSHAVEGILNDTYGISDERYNSMVSFEDISELNTWEKFFFSKARASGNNQVYGVGQVHFSPNSESDYDWENPTVVKSYYTDFLYNYPEIGNSITDFSPFETYLPTDGDVSQAHHEWWLSLMPHYKGRGEDGFLHNWWEYILRTDYVIEISYANETDKIISVPVGEKIQMPKVIVRYTSGKKEEILPDEIVYKCDENGFFLLEEGSVSGISCGMGMVEALYDGKKIEYSVEVTGLSVSADEMKIFEEFDETTKSRKRFAWITIAVTMIFAGLFIYMIKRKHK